MSLIKKLERKYARFAIKNLMAYLVAFTGLVFFLSYIDRTGLFINKLTLVPSLIMRGEFWRLFTYVFIPPTFSVFWIFFTLYFYYLAGASLEREWGSFRFNLYYFTGMLGITVTAFWFGNAATSFYLNLTLFLAFARLYPDFELLLFFIFPVKIKYLAWLSWGYLALTFIREPIYAKITVLISLANYFLFFGKEIIASIVQRHQTSENRRRFQNKMPRTNSIHKCVICGRTEQDRPELTFRYCALCAGDHEYCLEHLHRHEHIQADDKTEEKKQ